MIIEGHAQDKANAPTIIAEGLEKVKALSTNPLNISNYKGEVAYAKPLHPFVRFITTVLLLLFHATPLQRQPYFQVRLRFQTPDVFLSRNLELPLRNIYEAKTIINATGTGYIQHKKLQSETLIAEALQRISYSLPANFESTEKIAVIGHTPMAIDWAIQLKKRGVDYMAYMH